VFIDDNHDRIGLVQNNDMKSLQLQSRDRYLIPICIVDTIIVIKHAHRHSMRGVIVLDVRRSQYVRRRRHHLQYLLDVRFKNRRRCLYVIVVVVVVVVVLLLIIINMALHSLSFADIEAEEEKKKKKKKKRIN
jgi:hypothetical protein